MTRLLIRLCVFVAVLLSGVVISLASDCASNPNECTPKGLCEVATEVTDGNKLWSTPTFQYELAIATTSTTLHQPSHTAL